ncbi:MAG: substrate-binding domain-containing protein [Alphaproteobacteria bacterium]|nr:substrate-binding domain-containing protein [Alphaproteobacteria bacterium]
MRKIILSLLASLLLLMAPLQADARDYLLLQTTTSVDDSGLLAFILTAFTKDTGIKVKAVSLGSGLALAAAARGEADALITHSPALEKEYQAKGLFSKREKLFWNEFVVVGPPTLQDQFTKFKNGQQAFGYIAKKKLLFFSRGDNSGTHNKERDIWKKAKLDSNKFDHTWYKETGQGMGKTLQSAIAVNAITMSDIATFAKSDVKNYVVLFRNDNMLRNDYSIITMNKEKFPNLDHEKAAKFFMWMLSPRGQAIAMDYKINGKQMFFSY